MDPELDRRPTVSFVTDSVRLLTNHYSGASAAYERLWAGVLHPVARRLVARMPLAGARRVLDVGTGVGTLLPALAERAPDATVVGFDRSRGMIGRAPATFPRMVGDAGRLPFATGSFDAAVLAFMLFHLPDPAAGLSEARRVLADGGALGVATWGPDYAVPAAEIWLEELDRHGAPTDVLTAADNGAVNTTEGLCALLAAAGFADVERMPVTWEYAPTMERFIERHTTLGHTSRRMAGMPDAARAAFLADVRARLSTLAPEDFVSRREIIAVVAFGR